MKGLVWTLLAVGVPAVIVVAVLALVALIVMSSVLRWWLVMRRVQAASAPMQVAPALPPPPPPPIERWAAGAYGMWTGGEDCATWDGERARQSLQSWYGATDAAALNRTIDGLATGAATGNGAWDQVRAVDLVRIGIAAGYLTRPQGQQRIRELATAIRSSYSSWEEACAGFEAGMLAWQDSRGITDEGQRGRVQRNLPFLRSSIWPQIAYDAEL